MPKKIAKGIIVPHSSDAEKIISDVFSAVDIPELVFLIATHHEEIEKQFSIMLNGEKIHQPLTKMVMDQFPWFRENDLACTLEPSLQLPLQLLRKYHPHTQIVSMVVPDTSYEKCMALGDAFSKTALGSKEKILFITPVHFSHEMNEDIRHTQDNAIIETLALLNPEKFYHLIQNKKIKTCSLTPITSLLQTVSSFGASRIEKLCESKSMLVQNYGFMVS